MKNLSYLTTADHEVTGLERMEGKRGGVDGGWGGGGREEVGALYFYIVIEISNAKTSTRCCADNSLHVVYRHRVQTSSSCHTHGLTL